MRLSVAIGFYRLSAGSYQLLLHPFHLRRAFRQWSALRRQAMLAMLLLACRDEALHLTFRLIGRFQVLQILFRAIAVVGQDRSRTLPRLLLDDFHHRHSCFLSLAASVTDCPTINSSVGSTAVCA